MHVQHVGSASSGTYYAGLEWQSCTWATSPISCHLLYMCVTNLCNIGGMQLFTICAKSVVYACEWPLSILLRGPDRYSSATFALGCHFCPNIFMAYAVGHNLCSESCMWKVLFLKQCFTKLEGLFLPGIFMGQSRYVMSHVSSPPLMLCVQTRKA